MFAVNRLVFRKGKKGKFLSIKIREGAKGFRGVGLLFLKPLR